MNRIETLRKKENLTQGELCERLGISKKTYYNYVHKDVISSDVLIKLSATFGCSVDYLLGVKNYTDVIFTDTEGNVLAMITPNKVIEHSGYKIILSQGVVN